MPRHFGYHSVVAGERVGVSQASFLEGSRLICCSSWVCVLVRLCCCCCCSKITWNWVIYKENESDLAQHSEVWEHEVGFSLALLGFCLICSRSMCGSGDCKVEIRGRCQTHLQEFTQEHTSVRTRFVSYKDATLVLVSHFSASSLWPRAQHTDLLERYSAQIQHESICHKPVVARQPSLVLRRCLVYSRESQSGGASHSVKIRRGMWRSNSAMKFGSEQHSVCLWCR